jgi:hypothetical protein
MVDPVTALATATAAFNVIKKGFEVGRDVESMYGDMGRWMGACSDINQAQKMSQNPPLGRSLTLHMGRMHGMNFCKCKLKSENKEKK